MAGTLLHEHLKGHEGSAFHVMQLERAPNTGALHLQGYLQLAHQMDMTPLKELLGSTEVHLEQARGTPDENVAYCTKEPRVAGPWTDGQVRYSGAAPKKEKKIAGMMKDSLAGKTELWIALKYEATWMLHRKSLTVFNQLATATVRTWKTKVFWYSGQTGTGKTRLANLLTRRKAWIASDLEGKWFDGYCGQKDVIFDDLSFEAHPPRDVFLRLADRYQMSVPVKGGFVEWYPKRMFITSNFDWTAVYGPDPAVERRIDERVYF